MIYLDHNATSPLRPDVRAAMEPWLGRPANPASIHAAGREAAAAVEQARRQIADLLGVAPAGVVFTSGATEANHLGIRGAAAGREGTVAASAVEHPSVLAAAAACAGGHRVVGVHPSGRVDLDGIGSHVGVLAVQAANHETGVVQSLDEVRARAPSAWLHVDATQALGKVPVSAAVADALVLSGHKLGGPPGIGALVLTKGGEVAPLMAGAQERGRRGGTVPTALVVGLAAALDAALAEREANAERWVRWQHRVETALVELGGRIVGRDTQRCPHVTSVIFAGLRADGLVAALDLQGVCVSAGAACASGSVSDSPVLTAMGEPEPAGGVRLSMGWSTTQADVDGAIEAWPRVLAAARAAAEWA